jgi:hypothetical protein
MVLSWFIVKAIISKNEIDAQSNFPMLIEETLLLVDSNTAQGARVAACNERSQYASIASDGLLVNDRPGHFKMEGVSGVTQFSERHSLGQEDLLGAEVNFSLLKLPFQVAVNDLCSPEKGVAVIYCGALQKNLESKASVQTTTPFKYDLKKYHCSSGTWYGAHLLIAFESRQAQLAKCNIVGESVVLLLADSPETAHSMATEIGKARASICGKVLLDNIEYETKYLGTRKIISISNAPNRQQLSASIPGPFTELSFSEFEIENGQDLRSLLMGNDVPLWYYGI